MSERGSFRGGRGRGGRQSQQKGGGGGGGGAQEKPKKENILDLGKYMDKEVQVKFNGGREGEQKFGTSKPPF
jgi:U6 snRNA-associated Sm-like protein LSm7